MYAQVEHVRLGCKPNKEPMNEISEETVKKKKRKPTHGVPILPIADPIASVSQTSNMTTPKQKPRIIDIKTKQTDSKVGMVKTPSRA